MGKLAHGRTRDHWYGAAYAGESECPPGAFRPGAHRRSEAETESRATSESGLGVWNGELIRHLGEAGCGREYGRVGTLDLLVQAGLPVPTGVVLTRRAHEEFLQASGALRDIQDAAGGEGSVRRRAMQVRLGYASGPLEETLNQEICEALIGLHARAVVVLSEDLEEHGLGSIPEVRDAIVDAWLSPRGLEMQLEAAARGEDLPTWPVLVQRELRPRYTGWSTIGEAALCGGDSAGTPADAMTAALYVIEPVGGEAVGGKGIASFTLEAAVVLGEPVIIRWGLEGGRWYVLSTSLARR